MLHNAKKIPFVSQEGNTLLHLAINYCRSAEEIENFIKQLDPDEVSAMVRMTNNRGKIPAQLIEYAYCDYAEQMKIYDILFPYSSQKTQTNNSERVNFKDIKQHYNPQKGTTLYLRLKYACEVVNLIPEIAVSSTTNVRYTSEENFITAFKQEIIDLLNASDLSAFSFLISTTLGKRILNDPKVREKINVNHLNGVFKNGKSPVTYLTCMPDGIALLAKYPELVAHIEPDSLNRMYEDGISTAFFLIGFEEGCELLKKDQRLVKLINTENISSIIHDGPDKGLSAAYELVTTKHGRELLFLYPELLSKINETALFSIITKSNLKRSRGKCVADFLCQQRNADLFELLNDDLKNKIMEYKRRNYSNVSSMHSFHHRANVQHLVGASVVSSDNLRKTRG